MEEDRTRVCYVFRESGVKKPRYYKGPDDLITGEGEVLTHVKNKVVVWLDLSSSGRKDLHHKIQEKAGVPLEIVWVWGEPDLMVSEGTRKLKWFELTGDQLAKLRGGNEPMAPKTKVKKSKYKVGDTTPAGAKVMRVYEDTNRDHHRQRLEIKCLVTGKRVDIAIQDAFQVKFHKSVTTAERKAFLLNGKAPAKKKTSAKAKTKAKAKKTAKA